MSYDPTFSIADELAYADEMRAQLNALNDKIDAAPAGPQGPAGADVATGPQGPQGDPGTFPLTGPAIITGRIISDGGDLSIASNDPGGPAETALTITTDSASGTPFPQIVARAGGAVAYNIGFDLAGAYEGLGSNAVQDGDNIRFDAAKQAYVPRRSLAWELSDLMALTTPVSDPPLQSEVQANRDLINEILTRLKGMI